LKVVEVVAMKMMGDLILEVIEELVTQEGYEWWRKREFFINNFFL
jgi:hypothetical protein